ncbi:BapA/Bap/LapF family large adhesin [Vreelandella hamiltonii]|uniref:Type I secretion C-terminal target domain-containing protein n=1 Tax=Halomonas johnsoniae TaxID=502832 RepID=A0ABQ2WPK4_9GAMM|nr:BapA/Bap/LapF family large adhesin [Halomonas johnsoniae]GGW67231.1 hypothetical protein GCM10007158_29820 [Halomonas johnsoniae]
MGEDLTYAIDVPGSLLAGNDSISATVSGEDAAGNPYSADAERGYVVDTDAPLADPVLTGAETGSGNPVGRVDQVMFKSFTVGGGVDQVNGGFEQTPTEFEENASLGGEDGLSNEADLTFVLSSLPTYGKLYIDLGAGNYQEATTATEFDTTAKLYWSVTKDELQAALSSADTITLSGSDLTAWQNQGVDIYAYNLFGVKDNTLLNVSNGNLGVSDNTGLQVDAPNQLGERGGNSEELVFDFRKPVGEATVTVANLIAQEGEVGSVAAYLDGQLVGEWTFSNNPADKLGGESIDKVLSNGQFTINGVIFDQLRFTAKEYADGYTQGGGSGSDSSDYFVRAIDYKLVPDAGFSYQVIDAAGNESGVVDVIIGEPSVATDVPVGNVPVAPPGIDLSGSTLVVNEAFLKDGTKAGQGEPQAAGSFSVSSAAGIATITVAGKVLSVAELLATNGGSPIEIVTKEGNTLRITGYNGDEKGGALSYQFVLKETVSHSAQGTDSAFKNAIDVAVKDIQNQTSTGTIKVTVIDDTPEAFTLANVIQVPVSELEIAQLNAGWKNLTSTSGSGSVTTTANNQGVYIQWGGSSGSGYDFKYASGLTGSKPVDADSKFVVGTLTHNNFAISSDAKVLKTVDLQVSFKAVIDGVLTTVSTVIKLEHDETPNTNRVATHPDNDDFVKIKNPNDTQIIRVGDREYVLHIKGFLDKDGNLVDKVRTTETKANSFDLYAEISSTDDLPSVQGQLETNWGADGAATVGALLWRVNGQDVQTNTIKGQFGTLTVDASGNYTYVVDREVRDSMKLSEKRVETFTYVQVDADGDKVASTLKIDLSGVPNSVNAVDNVATADLTWVTITPPAITSQILGAQSSTHATANVRVDQYQSGVLTIGQGGSAKVSFNASFETPGSTKASLTWKLLQETAPNQFKDVSGFGGTAVNGQNNLELNGLSAGKYVVQFTATTSGVHTTGFLFFKTDYYSKVTLGDVGAVVQPASYQEPRLTEAKGNVLTDAGIDGKSDIPGSTDTVLKVWNGNAFVATTESGVKIVGKYGEFTLESDGDYTYRPVANPEHVGQIDSLTYQLVHPTGVTAEATLRVGITGPGVDSFVWGSEGNDTLQGNGGNNVIYGGEGSDILAGGAGADTFKWEFGDQGTSGSGAAVDKVTDFTLGVFGANASADRLDLADLLQNENAGNIDQYIKAEQQGADTVLHIKSDGGIASDGSNADQQIVLKNVQMPQGTSSSDFIQSLLDHDQLKIDQ